jgi:hypothetical protein
MKLTRRNVLTGLGAATLAGGMATVVPPVLAESGGSGFDGSATPEPQQVSVLAALTPGLSYLAVDPSSFHPLSSSSGRSVNQANGTSVISGTGGLAAALNLPFGATLREVTVAYSAPTAGPVFGLWKKPLSGQYEIVTDPPAGRPLTIGAGIQTATLTVNESIDGASSYMVLVNVVTSTTGLIHGLLVGYVPAAQGSNGFVPINPVRAFDSRQGGYVNAGPLARNTSRVISVKDAHDAGGAVSAADVVPVGAKAIACNLTATNTTAANYLALTPGDAVSFTASAINWIDSGDSIANGLIVPIDAARQVKVWAGDQAGSTDFIIDVAGYFVAL